MRIDTEQIAEAAFAEIAARFPGLQVIRETDAPVEISLTLPVQPGLAHKVWLCLQNDDELHFSVEHFWLEWFPCTDPSRVRDYVDAVCGYLSGQYRILEHYRGKKCVMAALQAPDGAGWKTIGTWGTPWWPIPWKKTFKEVRNR